MCCSTAWHCWTLFSHIIHAHVNTQICNLLQCTIFKDAKDPSKVLAKFWGWPVHYCYTDVRSFACDAQQLSIVEPWSQVPIPTHVNTQMCNPLQCTIFEEAEHPWIGYASILGVSCPPLLHSCSQCCLCYWTASHCQTLSSHITYTHVNTQICILLQCIVFKDAEHGWKVYNTFNTVQHCLVKSCQMKHRNAE